MAQSSFVAPKVQVEYVISTDVETETQAHVAPEMAFTLVDKQRFLEILHPENTRLSIEDWTLWDVLFGDFDECHQIFGGVTNPHVRYLTLDSCHQIIKHRLQFESGIDFQHLPAGFLLVKNPQGGVCDVLHYSEHYKQYQPQDDNNALAITLTEQAILNAPTTNESPFTGAKALWYAFFEKKRLSRKGAYCTDEQLKNAFIRLSAIIADMGLSFDDLDSEKCLNEEGNPVMLLGRWETVMSNPQLKKEDIKKQWQELPQLPLSKSNQAIRAITDYARDERPCGFVLSRMNLIIPQEQGQAGAGFKPIDNLNRMDPSGFWQYMAYQPRRNSITFYEKALARIDEMKPAEFQKKQLYQILAGSTTHENQSAKTEVEEKHELEVWSKLCTLAQPTVFYIPKERYMAEFIDHLHRISPCPNLAFFESVAQHINDNFSILGNQHLVDLSDKLKLVVHHLGKPLYQGAKFYFVDRTWKKMSIKDYVELQYYLYRLSCGIRITGERTGVRVHVNGEACKMIAPHLSTFNLTTRSEIDSLLARIPEIIGYSASSRLTFCFELFNDIQYNERLLPETLIQVIEEILALRIEETQDWRLAVLGYMDNKFNWLFEPNYFPTQEKRIRDECLGLSANQIARVKTFGFPQAAEAALISLESAIVQKNIPNANVYLDQVNALFLNLKYIITPEDFIQFSQQLNEMRDGVANDYEGLPQLLAQINQKRTLEGFSQIFVRNEIEKSQQHLVKKFTLFIEHIRPLMREKKLTLDKVLLQEALSTLVLNAVPDDWADVECYKQTMSELIDNLDYAAAAHPHIKHYLLDSLNHIPNKNTAEYMQVVVAYGLCMRQLSDILKPGVDGQAKENMSVIYSLLAQYHLEPLKLNQLIGQVHHLPDEHQAFMLTFLSRLKDNKQSIENVDQLIRLLCQDEKKVEYIITMLKTPPYPDVPTLREWLASNNFEEQYQTFNIKPYGERRLDYTFKFKQYKNQREHFVGIQENTFTDEVGRQLYWQLSDNRSKSVENLLSELKALRQALPLNEASKLKLLCLCIELLARTTSQQSHDKPPAIISQELNTTQVMALYAKLVNPGSRLISQIDTGEGKSRIMMILAACQAAQGKTVDFLTSDIALAERDYLAYRQFFTTLGIPASLMTLNTPSQLYQRGGVNFSDNGQLLLLRNRSDIDGNPHAYLDAAAKNRCLLVDEVDKFIHDKSKDAYNYAAQSKRLAGYVWIYPHLVRFMDELKLKSDQPFKPNEQTIDIFMQYIEQMEPNRLRKASLAALRAEDAAQILTWLRSARVASQLIADQHYIMTPPDRDKLQLLRDAEGHLRYSRKIYVLDNGRPLEGSTFSDGVHQCLCAKENLALQKGTQSKQDAFIITPENETQRSSFPASFMAKYDEGLTYGVSGTTRSAAPTTLDAINHENYTYLTVPREKALIREDKKVWLAKDEQQQIAFLKRAMLQRLASKGAVLLICKDDKQSLRLHDAINKDEDFMRQRTLLSRVYGLSSKEDELKAIEQAGQPGSVTISTAGMFGRGVDIHSDNLLVLSAYVPTEEDEIQIKGRTARIGKPGEYRMIPNMSDPDYPLNGYTYNVQNEVLKSQKQRQRTAAFQKEVSALYAFFLEDVTQQFLEECSRSTDNHDRVKRLETWQAFLGRMQKDWELRREAMLAAVNAQNETAFSELFNTFTQKWLQKLPVNERRQDAKQPEQLKKTYAALMAQQGFFTHKPQPITTVQREYDPSDDGQARVYSCLFPKTWATLCGKRRWFADFHAWREGRGYLFPDLMAVLKGERALFANLIATIKRWITELKAWWNGDAKKEAAPKVEELPERPLLLTT